MRLLCITLLFFLGACTQTGLLALNFPSLFEDGRIKHDVSYGPAPEQKLDIYMPADDTGDQREVIVFFYGGRWTSGAKEDYRFVGTTLADRGFIVVIPNYRKYPQVRFPTFIQDGAMVLAWTYDNIKNYHGSSNYIHVAGHSAGAHIGALLTTDAHYLADLGKVRSRVIRNFAGMAGPYDFIPDEPDLKDMFGKLESYPLMRATTFIDGKQPPMLLLFGASDTTVELGNLQRVQQAIESSGGTVKSVIYPDTDHVGILLGLSWLKSDDAPVLLDMTTFFNTANKMDGIVPENSASMKSQ